MEQSEAQRDISRVVSGFSLSLPRSRPDSTLASESRRKRVIFAAFALEPAESRGQIGQKANGKLLSPVRRDSPVPWLNLGKRIVRFATQRTKSATCTHVTQYVGPLHEVC